ncbi:MAG TPA: biotin transporter BioY, partial [Cellulomonas sp.]
MSNGLTHDLPTTASLAAPPSTRETVTGVALVAGMAALVAVCAVSPAIPTPVGVPITLQTFGVLLAGLLTGARRGAASVALYVAAGLAGLPLLAGGAGGVGVLAGP